MATVILTWNPSRSTATNEALAEIAQATAKGKRAETRWSTGVRKGGVIDEDRVFLLKQGKEGVGIAAAGHARSQIYQAPHWDPARKGPANYVDVDFEVILDQGPLLAKELLVRRVPGVHWDMQGSGVVIGDADAAKLERLWGRHIKVTASGANTPKRRKRPTSPTGGAGWRQDPVRRKMVEDYAQAWLEDEYRRAHWIVKDTRHGNPFDAIATKGREKRYLEAKGTETDGTSVEVTIGEVTHARKRPGQCVLGIVSGIQFSADGSIDVNSGQLTLHEWDPDTGDLNPSRFRWHPPSGP